MTKSTKQRTNGDDGMADEQIIELAGTKVDTLWTTVESGKLEDGTKYKKKQRLAPRTFEKAVQDDDGVLLSTKLTTMQQQIGSVGGNVIGNVENLETENKETIVGAINEVNANSDTTLERLINSGILSNALEHTSINEAFTFEDLISKKEITFFTNWSDLINFPELYGSGIFLPGYDTRCNSIIYTTSPTPYQKDFRHVYVGYIFVAEEEGDNQGLTTGVEWKQLMTNDEVINPNLLINPDFSIDQRDGYIIKIGCTVYNEPALTTDVSNLGLSNRPRQVTYKTNTYAAFLGDNGYTYYVNINDIEKGYIIYTSSWTEKQYTFDRWFLRGYGSFKKEENEIVFTKMVESGGGFALLGTILDDVKDLEGKALTLTLCLNDTIISNTSEAGWSFTEEEQTILYVRGFKNFNGIVSLIANASRQLEIRIYLANGLPLHTFCKIKWAKLELGSVATKFIPPQKSSELIKCKYFYQELITNKAIDFIDPNFLVVNLQFEEMRVIPTAKFKNNKFNEGNYTKVQGNTLANDIFEFELQPVNTETNTIHVKAKKINHGLNFINTLIIIGKGNPVCLDAELY